jgi:hypothetical protein
MYNGGSDCILERERNETEMRPDPSLNRSASTIARIRAEGLREWIKQNAPNCFVEQKHLDEGSVERAYWHYGYLSALQDLLKVMSPSED